MQRSLNRLATQEDSAEANFGKSEPLSASFCLRRWPRPNPHPSKLVFIHDVLQHVYATGCQFVALPLKSKSGETLIRLDDHAWEVTEWVQGAADFSNNPNEKRLAASVAALARFHLAAAEWRSTEFGSQNLQTVTRNLERVPQAMQALSRNTADLPSPDLATMWQIVQQSVPRHAQSLLDQLKPFRSGMNFMIQPVIRDIWHDHLFFLEDKVSGIVDFGAMASDIVSFDLSRLLGSLVGDQPDRFRYAIEVYEQLRPLSPAERDLIPILDRCGVVIGCLHWLKWLAVEQREFESASAVNDRILLLTRRLIDMSF